MFVEEIVKPSTNIAKRRSTGTGYHPRTGLDSAAQQNRIARHLNELEQDNYHPIQIEIPKSESMALLNTI